MLTKTLKVSYKVNSHDSDAKLGTLTGLASTFGNADRQGDIIGRNAFDDTVAAWQAGDKMLPFLDRHENLIGGINPKTLKITDEGLEFVAKIDKNVEAGRDVMSLAGNKFLTATSIGFHCSDYTPDFKANTVTLNKIDLYELSAAPVAANPNAEIRGAKAVPVFKDYELMSEDTVWDADTAVKAWRSHTDSTDSPSEFYRDGFMYFDASNADDFTAYKLPYVMVTDGSPKAVPRAIFAIASVLEGGRGGVDIPDKDKIGVRRQVERYYKKMGKKAPFDGSADNGADNGADMGAKWLADLFEELKFEIELKNVIRRQSQFYKPN